MHQDYYFSTYDMCIGCGGYAPYNGGDTYCKKCRKEIADKEIADAAADDE